MVNTALGTSKPPLSLHNSAINIPCCSLLSPHKKPNKNHLFTLKPQSVTFSSLHQTHYNNNRHNPSRVFALKKGSKGGRSNRMDTDVFDEVEGEDDEYSVDDKPDGVFIFPFGKMKEWYENKPGGFGEGKVYDTSVEEKLLDEIQQSRSALAKSINNGKAGTKKDKQNNNKAPEAIPSGIRVRLSGLPKKKNIHRDLKAAFEGVPGIITVIPAVSGNNKTRDPVCKGFAFVDFKTEEDATGFIQMFSEQSIAFGKTQKRIKCEMMNPPSPNSVHKQAADVIYAVPEVLVTEPKEDPTDSEMDDSWVEATSYESEGPYSESDVEKLKDIKISALNHSSLQFWEETKTVDEYNDTEKAEDKKNSEIDGSSLELWMESASDAFDDSDDESDSGQLKGMEKHLETVSVSVQNGFDSVEPATMLQSLLVSSNPLEGIQALEKKLLAKGRVAEEKRKVSEKKARAKGKVKKFPKLDVPGSAKRLKIREKAVLTDVLSRYGAKAASASKKEADK